MLVINMKRTCSLKAVMFLDWDLTRNQVAVSWDIRNVWAWQLGTSWSNFWKDIYVVASKILKVEGQFWRLIEKKRCFLKKSWSLWTKKTLRKCITEQQQQTSSVQLFVESISGSNSVMFEWFSLFRKLLYSVNISV